MINIKDSTGKILPIDTAIKNFCIEMTALKGDCSKCPLRYNYNDKKTIPRYLCCIVHRAAILSKVDDDVNEVCRRMNWKVIDDDRSEHN